MHKALGEALRTGSSGFGRSAKLRAAEVEALHGVPVGSVVVMPLLAGTYLAPRAVEIATVLAQRAIVRASRQPSGARAEELGRLLGLVECPVAQLSVAGFAFPVGGLWNPDCPSWEDTSLLGECITYYFFVCFLLRN